MGIKHQTCLTMRSLAPLHFFTSFAVTLSFKAVRPSGPTRFSQHHSLPLNPPVITHGGAAASGAGVGSSWSHSSWSHSSLLAEAKARQIRTNATLTRFDAMFALRVSPH